jgi:hypothetical protein
MKRLKKAGVDVPRTMGTSPNVDRQLGARKSIELDPGRTNMVTA